MESILSPTVKEFIPRNAEVQDSTRPTDDDASKDDFMEEGESSKDKQETSENYSPGNDDAEVVVVKRGRGRPKGSMKRNEVDLEGRWICNEVKVEMESSRDNVKYVKSYKLVFIGIILKMELRKHYKKNEDGSVSE